MNSLNTANKKETKKNHFSKLATSSLDTIFPPQDTPYTNINIEVELDIFCHENFKSTVNVSTTKDIQKSVADAACMIANEWINDILPKDDDLSINDLGNATVSIINTPLVFDIQLNLQTYVEKVNKK